MGQSNGMLIPSATLTIRYPIGEFKHVSRDFKSYRELRRELPQLLRESADNEVRVRRFRRGLFGEWFEVWSLRDGKPYLEREGWM